MRDRTVAERVSSVTVKYEAPFQLILTRLLLLWPCWAQARCWYSWTPPPTPTNPPPAPPPPFSPKVMDRVCSHVVKPVIVIDRARKWTTWYPASRPHWRLFDCRAWFHQIQTTYRSETSWLRMRWANPPSPGHNSEYGQNQIVPEFHNIAIFQPTTAFVVGANTMPISSQNHSEQEWTLSWRMMQDWRLHDC